MEKNPYLVLGVSENATEAEIRAAHERQRKQYSELLFSDGEAGMDASRRLSELDLALSDALDDCRRRKNREQFGSEFGAVENAIKSGDLDGAQRMLDGMESRSGEWHYLQSIVYYKKGMNAESKKQLQMALNIEPGNEKYQKSLNRMNEKESVPGAGYSEYGGQNYGPGGFQQGSGQNYNNYGDGRGGYTPPPQNTGGSAADSCCTACTCACCADACCDLFNCC